MDWRVPLRSDYKFEISAKKYYRNDQNTNALFWKKFKWDGSTVQEFWRMWHPCPSKFKNDFFLDLFPPPLHITPFWVLLPYKNSLTAAANPSVALKMVKTKVTTCQALIMQNKCIKNYIYINKCIKIYK